MRFSGAAQRPPYGSGLCPLLSNWRGKGFSFFFREYYAALCYFSYQIIKDKEEAEEIAELAFIKLWERHANFDNAASIKSFLYITTRNASLNWTRQRKSNGQRSMELARHYSGDSESTTIHQIIEAELYREILQAINTLLPKCRQIIRTLFFEGKDYKQIAQELNLSIDTVRNQKARGLMLIKKRIVLDILIIVALEQFN